MSHRRLSAACRRLTRFAVLSNCCEALRTAACFCHVRAPAPTTCKLLLKRYQATDGQSIAAAQEVFLTPHHLAIAMEYAPGGDLSLLVDQCRARGVRAHGTSDVDPLDRDTRYHAELRA